MHVCQRVDRNTHPVVPIVLYAKGIKMIFPLICCLRFMTYSQYLMQVLCTYFSYACHDPSICPEFPLITILTIMSLKVFTFMTPFKGSIKDAMKAKGGLNI